jgi:hypothetical protein
VERVDASGSDGGTDGNAPVDANVPVDAPPDSPVDAADASVIPTSGLVGEWLCAGNVTDTSGNANNGTATAITYGADRHGKGSAACFFDGKTSGISVPSSASLGVTTSWSLSVWVNATSFSVLAGIVSKYQTNNAKGPAVRLSYYSPFTGVDIDEAINTPDAGNGMLSAGSWTHIGAVVNGTSVTCYVNGVVSYTGTAGYTAQTNSDPLVIGIDYANRFFAGAIDDVRLYDRVLSAAEIEALYLAP